MGMSEVMKAKRNVLGLSQSKLAEIVGVTQRQIARYEAGEQQPVLGVAAAIANALGVSLSELAGEESPHPDLRGTWWSAWEQPGLARNPIAIDEIYIHQHEDTIRLSPEGAVSATPAGHDWRGDLRMEERRVLVGSFRGGEAKVENKGTLYFVLDTENSRAQGRWVGLADDGSVATGWTSLARSQAEAREMVARLIGRGGSD